VWVGAREVPTVADIERSAVLVERAAAWIEHSALAQGPRLEYRRDWRYVVPDLGVPTCRYTRRAKAGLLVRGRSV
jgi:hypothetical protein